MLLSMLTIFTKEVRKAHYFYSANGFTVNRLTNGKQYSFALLAVSTEDVSSDATIATHKIT